METIQIVIDNTLLQAADKAARQAGKNRSALVRDALKEHLRRLELLASEERDREGYLREPQPRGESHLWEAEATWSAE